MKDKKWRHRIDLKNAHKRHKRKTRDIVVADRALMIVPAPVDTPRTAAKINKPFLVALRGLDERKRKRRHELQKRI